MSVVGLIIIILSVPMFIAWLRSGTAQRNLAYAAVAAMPFFIAAANLDAALINWSQWPGYTKGAIVTLLDSLALAILITHSKARITAWLWVPLVLYIMASLLSVAFAGVWMGSAFYVFQLLRVLLVLLAVAAISIDLGAVRAIGFGLAGAMVVEAVYTIYEKLNGAAQAAGTLGHQNLLGMASHFALFPLLGLILAGERSKLIGAGVLGGLIAVALGGSRATIGLTAVGMILLLVLSVARRPTTRKLQIIGGTALVFALVAVLAFSTLSSRFGGRNDALHSDSERLSLARAANSMIDDHPMGVGANQYVLIANSEGYSQRAGVAWNFGSRGANVHDFFLLTRAELGLIGLVFGSLWLVASIVVASTYAWRDRKDPRGEIHLGIAVAVLIVTVHNFYEWIFVTSEVEYLFAINLGMSAGMAFAWQRDRREARRAAKARAANTDIIMPPLAASR